ncbi:DUF1338 domain-containing protein [Puteibacter caeruleilacunae]|nr:DUF1338 domain-containing protein [Puteibacter caeruleilacunae]
MKTTARQITQKLLDKLWDQYIHRVSYAKRYTEMVEDRGGTVANDHIAFRSLNTYVGHQAAGISAISDILGALEYTPQDRYKFATKKLSAIHFEHPDEMFPKIFVSQLEVDQLPESIQELINEAVKDTPNILTDRTMDLLQELKKNKELNHYEAEYLADELFTFFRRPWDPPLKETVITVNEVSQYAAWVLLHGNSVNHFTAYINYQNVSEWPDLEATVNALRDAGIPMKKNIEGEKGSKLQQSSTEAVNESCLVKNKNRGIELMDWTYAYYELAQRGYIETKAGRKLFQGFLGDQATHLFDMTQK